MRRNDRIKRIEAAGIAAQRGMTLIEIMIVLVIIATIATGVTVALLPALERGRKKAAQSDVAAIRSAVQMYVAENPGACPNVEDLKTERYLDKDKRTQDPWNKDFVVRCADGDDPDVFSVGADGQEGSEDDVR